MTHPPHTGAAAGSNGPRDRYLDPTRPLFIALLAFATALQAVGTTITLPALPAIAAAFGATPDRAQVTLSAYLGGLALGVIPFGALTDRFGRRPILLFGMGLFTLAGIACTFAPDIDVLIAARAAQGFAGGAAMIIGRAIIRDLFDRERGLKVMSVMVGVMTMIPMISPFAGGVIMRYLDWRPLFGILALLSAALTLVVWMFIPESIRQRDRNATDPRRILANCLEVLRRPESVSFPLIVAVIFGGFFAYLALIPFIAIQGFHLGAAEVGWLSALNGVALWSGALTNNRLSGRWPVRRLLHFSTGLALAAGLLSLAACAVITLGLMGDAGRGMPGLALLVAPTLAYSFTFGVSQPNCIVMGLQPVPHIAGTASAVAATLQMTSASLFTWVAGLAYDGTPMALGYMLFATSLVSFLIFTLLAVNYTPAPKAQRHG
jgi:DHA1 family bicyclomycin/chloramphenicol resistance-like MFS transporter